MTERLPVNVVAAMDGVLRQTAASAVLWDFPGGVVVQHDLARTGHDDLLHRLVYDVGGVVEDTGVPLDHACLSCALREDVVPTVVRLARSGRWDRIVVSLPVTAEPGLVRDALRGSVVGGSQVADLVTFAGVLTVVDLARLVDDLFGDDLLAERGIALTHDDRRAVGEALAHQIESADVVATRTDRVPDARELAVLRHLAAPSAVCADLHNLDLARTLDRPARGCGPQRGDYRRAAHSGAADTHGVWTLELTSWRPVHPARLHDRIGELAGGRQRSRGWFWLPTRPHAVCGWDNAGGQLSIGTVGRWEAGDRQTRILVTGIEDVQERVRAAFDAVLMTDSELARGLDHWERHDDGFSPWLGDDDRAA
ncbi:GTP-binding protein [Actinopolymorpha sp. NPDC004070]|uniref:CobW family GTP-binding protein n=1 Tax=Actinopolymorpha sp. NPDC004070 TaxID=3154548 RepID=UPI0033A4ECDA